MHLLENKRETPLSVSKEIRKLRFSLGSKVSVVGRKSKEPPFHFAFSKYFGFKSRQVMFQEKQLMMDPLLATSILRFCSTCLFLQQTSPNMYYGYVSECEKARSIAQAFFKLLLVSHFLTSYWPKQITEFIPESEWSTLQSYVVKTWKWTRWKIGTIFEIYHTYPYYFPAIS